MINKNPEKTKSSKRKVYFIRVNEDDYKRISALAEVEDRSINNMANSLIKSALRSKEGLGAVTQQ